MRKAKIQIAALAGILLAVCLGYRFATGNTYTAVVRFYAEGGAPQVVRASAEDPGVARPGTPQRRGDSIRIPICPGRPGRTFVDLTDGDGKSIGCLSFRVGRFGTVYDDSTGGFTADAIVPPAIAAFFLAAAAIMYRAFRRTKGAAFYAYSTIYAAGFSLFALLTGLMMLGISIRRATRPDSYSMLSAYNAVSSAGWGFMFWTSPLLLAFAAAMAASNVALLRHEGYSPRNLLGIGVSAGLVLGEAFAFWLFSRNFSGSEWEMRVHNTVQNVYATGFAYFECVLVGAILCGLKAARHVPEADANCILILGCRLRGDGTLTPLLKGRVDRAVEFWERQKKETGREAVLMPSGGQGADEIMPEAEAMRRYLLRRQIPERCVMAENRSASTLQNMTYCKALIDETLPGAKVVFVTTNYHVFRSGVWSARAGLSAEGLGSRTKWWYWPNAFMRECAGLLRNRIWQELGMLAAMLLFFGALSMALV